MHVCSFTNGYDMGGGQFMWGDYFVVVVVGLFTDVYTDVCTQIKKCGQQQPHTGLLLVFNTTNRVKIF